LRAATPFFTAWISARHIRYPDNYTSSISGYPNAATYTCMAPSIVGWSAAAFEFTKRLAASLSGELETTWRC